MAKKNKNKNKNLMQNLSQNHVQNLSQNSVQNPAQNPAQNSEQISAQNSEQIPAVNPMQNPVHNLQPIKLIQNNQQISGVILLSTDYYNELLRDNQELKNLIITLNGTITTQSIQIQNGQNIIKNLEIENDMLREIIKQLKDENNKLNENKLFKKLLLLTQDLNSSELLETIMPSYKTNLEIMRQNRNIECHIFSKNDTSDIKNLKKYIIKIFLNKLPKQIIEKFEDYFKLHNFFLNINTKLSNDLKNININSFIQSNEILVKSILNNFYNITFDELINYSV